MSEKNRSLIWYAFGQCWVDHPLEDTDFYYYLEKLYSSNVTIEQIENEVKRHVCWGFSSLSFKAYITLGMTLPSWSLPAEEIDIIKTKYDKTSKLFLFINPACLLGYRISTGLVEDAFKELCRFYK